MKRDEAIFLMKELLESCPELDTVFMCLTPPTVVAPKLQGYQIHLRVRMDHETEQCVQKITGKYGLLVEESKSKDTVMIYRKH